MGAARSHQQHVAFYRNELENLTLTQATSFDDYMGRAVLIEFFAYW